MNKPTRTDWERLANLDDADIDTSDIPLLGDTFFKRAKVLLPLSMINRWIPLDGDIVQWLEEHNQRDPQAVNRILRLYIEAHSK
jgi:hypothetical protein